MDSSDFILIAWEETIDHSLNRLQNAMAQSNAATVPEKRTMASVVAAPKPAAPKRQDPEV